MPELEIKVGETRVRIKPEYEPRYAGQYTVQLGEGPEEDLAKLDLLVLGYFQGDYQLGLSPEVRKWLYAPWGHFDVIGSKSGW